MQVIINSGPLSADNGAIGPLSLYFELAGMLKAVPLVGAGYYDDRLEVSDSDWPVVEELLKEANMLYKVVGAHTEWQNVKTDRVRQCIAPSVLNC